MYKYNDNYCFVNLDKTDSKRDILKNVINELAVNNFNQIDISNSYYRVITPVANAVDIAKYRQAALDIRHNFSDVVIIGMGGATLNPKSMLNLIGYNTNSIRIHFLDNTDPYYFKTLEAQLNLSDTMFLVISNSGETLETIILFKAIVNLYKKSDLNNFARNFNFIVGINDNSLCRVASDLGAKIYPHQDGISGRYAGFTNITIFVGLIAGFDVDQFIAGANEVFNNFWRNPAGNITTQAAITIIELERPILANIGYLQRFAPFLEWYSQIIAESLGKQKGGFTPIRGLGPNDNHSMMQLYLDGKDDKLITMFHVKKIHNELDKYEVDNLYLNSSSVYSLKSINDISFQSALNALATVNAPVRTIELDDLSEKSVGALIAHCMLEVILVGSILRVNPFDQPAVEILKHQMRELIQKNELDIC